MDKKNKKIYFLIELSFILINIAFLIFYRFRYNPTTTLYDNYLFIIIVSAIIILCVLLGPIVGKVASYLLTFFFGLYLLAQVTYYSVFSMYFRLSYVFSLSKEIGTFKDSIFDFITFKNILSFIALTIILLFYIILYLKFQKKLIEKEKYVKRLFALALLIPCLICCYLFSSLLDSSKQQEGAFTFNKTDYYLYDTVYSSGAFVDQFGLITFGYRDICKMYEIEDYSQYKDKVTEFLNNNKEHIDNEYTGIFEGKNVLFIQAESFNNYAIDEELTPVLYKLKSKGININGFNNPSLVGSTNDIEYLTNMSLISDSDEYASCYKYILNKYDTTLASVFNKAGYYTVCYHNCYGVYYNRDMLMIGIYEYNDFYDCTKMFHEDQTSDSLFVENLCKNLFSDTKPIMGYWITYSGHQTYTLDSVGVKKEYVNKIREIYPDLDDEHTSYLAKNMDLDRSVEYILNEAKKQNKEDDLVIVLFGDHAAKGLDLGDKSSTELYIYCSDKELSLTVNKPSTSLDILPTIANLFNLDYDYKTILGQDILDDSYHGYCFKPTMDFITNDYKCDYKGNVFDYNDNQINDKELLDEANRYLDYKRISKIIQKLDYFNK